MMNFRFLNAWVGLALLCSSCAHAPLSERARTMPATYRGAPPGAAGPNRWWTAFGDEALDALVERALAQNWTLEQAAARLRQAEASAIEQGAARVPSLSATGRAQANYQNDRSLPDAYRLGLSASYELDLWGRVAAHHQAARQAVRARQFDLQTSRMSVVAETVRAYFTWQEMRARLALFNRQLADRRAALSIVEMRFKTARDNAVDLWAQRERVAAAEAALLPVQSALESARNVLAVWIGQAPQANLLLVAKPLPALPARPAAGLPADLLTRRPDLQSAWAELARADWNVRAAQAARLPTLTLTGSSLASGSDLDGILDDWMSHLAAGLAMPLIDGGGRRAAVRRARAAADEQFAAYRQMVLEALAEVDTALVSEQKLQEQWRALRRQTAYAQSAAEEAYRRYTRGQGNYLDALNLQTAFQNRQLQELSIHLSVLNARVQLCRALGGDWRLPQEESDEE